MVVTGAGGGLGRATAEALARLDANLLLVDIDADALAETKSLLAHSQQSTVTLAQDLGSQLGCNSVIDFAIKQFGGIDALCNIAAVLFPANVADFTSKQWESTLAVNLSAPFYLIQRALPTLEENQGSVVNVTSCAAHLGQPYIGAYSAAKAGLTQLTKSLAMEYMNRKVRFNVVAPGGMATSITHAMKNIKTPDPQLLSRMAPLRGMVEIEEVAQTIAYLATPAASSFHGAVINIDQGITLG